MKKSLIFISIFVLYVFCDYIFFKILNNTYPQKNPYDAYYESKGKVITKNEIKYIVIYGCNALAIFYLCVLKNPFLHRLLRIIHSILVGFFIYLIQTVYLKYTHDYPNELVKLDLLFNSIAYPLTSYISVNLSNSV